MTTTIGIAHCISRLCDCPNLTALRTVWGNLGVSYQREPAVMDAKDKMKEALKDA